LGFQSTQALKLQTQALASLGFPAQTPAHTPQMGYADPKTISMGKRIRSTRLKQESRADPKNKRLWDFGTTTHKNKNKPYIEKQNALN